MRARHPVGGRERQRRRRLAAGLEGHRGRHLGLAMAPVLLFERDWGLALLTSTRGRRQRRRGLAPARARSDLLLG